MVQSLSAAGSASAVNLNRMDAGTKERAAILATRRMSLKPLPSRRWTFASLLSAVRAWLVCKGANGAIFTNGTVLSIFAVQMLAWVQMGRISRMVATVSNLPRGRRRPDVDSFSGRLIGWMVENGGVWTLCNLRSLLPHPEPISDQAPAEGVSMTENFLNTCYVIVRNMAISTASNLIAEEGAVWLLHVASTRLYPLVPYFTDQRRSANPLTVSAIRDWVRGNGIVQILGGGVMLGLIESFMPHAAAKEVTETEFTLVKFLRNFAIFRTVVDIVFYVGHRQLHVNKWLYNNVHKRHHEHYTTNLRTNYHFTAPDLFIESAVPVFCGIGFLRGICGIKVSRYELHLMMTYVAWHESGTHLGKPLPVISMYPPLSILYNAFTNSEGRTAIEFHEVHHNRRHCNYGITQWIDMLMGSRRLKASPKQ